MKAAVFDWLRDLRATYWFIPAWMATLAVGLSFGLIALDTRLGDRWLRDVGWLYLNQPDGARAVLSTIAGSMITVAGVTFSMTILTVSFAAGQMGPRLLNNFMRDRGNQVTLGMFISAFLYCLMVLRVVRDRGEATGAEVEAFVPHISIAVALALAVAGVAVLIYFIHHVPDSINVSQVIAKVGRDLHTMVGRQFPRRIGEEADEGRPVHDAGAESDLLAQDARAVLSEKTGYVRAVDESDLMDFAKRHDVVVRLGYRPGDFISEGKAMLYAWPADRVTDAVAEAGRAVFAVGSQRTRYQNIFYLIDELVEIATRALSPGVNDPFTANSCLDWLGSVLQNMAGREAPGALRYDADQALRVIAHPISFEAMSSRVFDQLLPYVSADRNAALHTMKVIAQVTVELGPGAKRETMLEHASRLRAAAADHLPLKVDRAAVDERYQQLLNLTVNAAARARFRDDQGWLGGSA